MVRFREEVDELTHSNLRYLRREDTPAPILNRLGMNAAKDFPTIQILQSDGKIRRMRLDMRGNPPPQNFSIFPPEVVIRLAHLAIECPGFRKMVRDLRDVQVDGGGQDVRIGATPTPV